jgi:excisionase family DNA binding protein
MNDEPAAPPRPKWYSIQEAAAYLEIGEPTLYRWMRDGKITYRKVGDSTRFWREDLDAVMEVFHSERDIDNVRNICPSCHSGRLVEGVFRSTGLNYFQPRKTKFWTLKASEVPTQAFMCERCGAVHLFADVKKLAALKTQKPEPKAPPAE